MSDSITIPLVWLEAGGAVLAAGVLWRVFRPKRKSISAKSKTSRAAPISSARPNSVPEATPALPVPKGITEEDLIGSLSRATSAEDCRNIHALCQANSKVEQRVAEKHDSFLAAELAQAMTIDECDQIASRALSDAFAEQVKARKRVIASMMLAEASTFEAVLRLFERESDDDVAGAYLDRAILLASTPEQLRKLYDTATAGDEEDRVADKLDAAVLLALETAPTTDECKKLVDMAIDTDAAQAKANERLGTLIELELATATTVEACLELYDNVPKDEDDELLPVGNDILKKAITLATTADECSKIYFAFPGEDEETDGELATEVILKGANLTMTTTACLKYYDEVGGMIEETCGKVLDRALALAASYDDCDAVGDAVDSLNSDDCGPAPNDVIAKKIEFIDDIGDCIEMIRDDDLDDEEIYEKAIVRAAELIAKRKAAAPAAA